MAAVTGTFTATGQSASFTPASQIRDGMFNVSMSGTFSATVVLQRSFDGTNWFTVSKPDLTDASFTAGVSFIVQEVEDGVRYRLNCTAYTSGTVTYRLGA